MEKLTAKKLTAQEVAYLLEEKSQRKMDKISMGKLTYIAFGVYGSIIEKGGEVEEEPEKELRYLFLDRIEAWQYGPVIPNLYYNNPEKPNPEKLQGKSKGKFILATINLVVSMYNDKRLMINFFLN